MKRIHLLPNLLTLANYFCGLLAITKAIDALTLAESVDLLVFYKKLEAAAWLIFLAMVFDVLDGAVARLTRTTSDFGAQLDSLADALTFGVAPALLAKVLIEHEGPLLGYSANPRLHFFAAGLFSIMAVLRLARFNLETDGDSTSHEEFRGLPSPAAAGAAASFVLLYLSLRERRIETTEGTPTPVGEGLAMIPGVSEGTILVWFLPALALLLPVLGFLMVSRVPYSHISAAFLHGHSRFLNLVGFVVGAFVLFMAPVPVLFVIFHGYVLFGLVRMLPRALSRRHEVRMDKPERPVGSTGDPPR